MGSRKLLVENRLRISCLHISREYRELKPQDIQNDQYTKNDLENTLQIGIIVVL